ncbi:hypothetical protein [Pseudomonas sp. BF-B-26]|uniref:hypothetical protein n=1 Tax=Pseudomonas sp. BF-B-26 TaxID=2832400 RepID=UPI001CBCDA0D|nr:hypothetical protein [Pseudomonas sp. BF-B-26]
MDRTQASALAQLLVNLHNDNFGKISTQAALHKYSALKAVEAKKTHAPIFYSDLPKLKLEASLVSFFTKPNTQSPYVIVDIDRRNGWIKLLRFVTTKYGEINAEAVCLCGDDVDSLKGFGYRFEHPERFPDNKHGFFHVQPIAITETEVALPVRPPWLPATFPTFYMFASCAYELILYAIHALSGWEALSRYRNKNVDKNPVLSMLVRVGTHASNPYPGL